MLAGTPLVLGAQNCGWADGPWTGEVSPSMLAELGVGLVEIGHAERRRYFAEDEAMIALKVSAAVDAGLTPLLCVGEPEILAPEAGGSRGHGVRADQGSSVRRLVPCLHGWSLPTSPSGRSALPEPASAGYVSEGGRLPCGTALAQHGLAGIAGHLRRLGEARTVAAAGRGVRAFPRPFCPRRRQLRQGPGRSPRSQLVQQTAPKKPLKER